MEITEIVMWAISGFVLWVAAGAAFGFGWVAFNQAVERTTTVPENPASDVAGASALGEAASKSVFA